MIWGWSQIGEQHRLLSTAREVAATVIASIVEWQPGPSDRRSEYKPDVRFKYVVDAKSHESSMVAPGRDSGRHGWAHETVKKFPAGATTTAYYDPSDPSVAFLLKEYLPDPYLLTGFSCMFAGFTVVFPASFFRPWPRLRGGMALAGVLVYELPIILAIKHYIEHAVPQHPQAGMWSAVAIGLGVVPLLLAFRWWRLDPKHVAKKLYAEEE